MTTLDTPWSERTSWSYDGVSRLATLTLANGATTTYAYDSASRVTGIRHAKAGGTVIAGFQYTRDAVGNPTGVSLADGNLVTFAYDDTYRLTRERRSGTGAYDITYTFDAVGNRTTKQSGGTTTTYTLNEADRLTVEDAAGALTTYTWDAAGNNTAINAVGSLTTYTWDLLDRLTAANAAGTLSTFTYAPDGLRESREDSGGLTRFLWDGQTLLQELDAGGSPTARYASAPGGYGPIVSQCRGAVSHFLHGTDLGTVEALTDASGDTTDTYVNAAFGVATASSGSTPNPHRFVGALGYYTDPLGPLYVRARWLRASTGSWLSSDPVLSEPRYQYVGGRAGRATDGSGLQGSGDEPWWIGQDPQGRWHIAYVGLPSPEGPTGPIVDVTVMPPDWSPTTGRFPLGKCAMWIDPAEGPQYCIMVCPLVPPECRPPIWEEEQQHAVDEWECLRRYGECLSSAGTEDQRRSCEDMFEQWRLGTAHLRECRARYAAYVSAQLQYSKYDCPRETDECRRLEALLRDYLRFLNEVCQGRDQPPPNLTPCPFGPAGQVETLVLPVYRGWATPGGVPW